jgi:hypothetical protein
MVRRDGQALEYQIGASMVGHRDTWDSMSFARCHWGGGRDTSTLLSAGSALLSSFGRPRISAMVDFGAGRWH